jgi:hypothetical protein
MMLRAQFFGYQIRAAHHVVTVAALASDFRKDSCSNKSYTKISEPERAHKMNFYDSFLSVGCEISRVLFDQFFRLPGEV